MTSSRSIWAAACGSFALIVVMASAASATEYQNRWNPRYNPQPRNHATELLIEAGEHATSAGKLAEAERDYKLAEAKCLALKKDNEDQKADIFSLLSKLYRQQKKFDLAILYATKLADQEKKMYGTEHILIAEDFKTLGEIQSEAGRYKVAEQSFRQAIALAVPAEARQYNYCSLARSDNDNRKLELVSDSYKALTDCLEKDNNVDAAEAAYKQALEGTFKSEDMDVFRFKEVLAQGYVKFLERNDRDTTKAKEQLQGIERRHELNHEFRPGELPNQ